MSGFCRWYGKDMEDVTEHEQEQCEENGQDCRECPDLMIKEQEAAGHERYNTDSLIIRGNWFASMCLEKFEHPNKSNRLCGDQ